MQNKFVSKSILAISALIAFALTVHAEIPSEVRHTIEEGFKASSYNTNFASEQLFSIADMKRKTYAIRGSKSLRLTRAGIYDPATEALGSPMFQVLASTVIIDLNGAILSKNVASSEVRCVGMEIGYTPAMIALDPTLTIDSQPQNVIIRNGTLDNFDIGIIVHEGVRSVTFENVSFSRTPVGIVLMGSSTDTEHGVNSISINDVKIIGDYIDEGGADADNSSLIWAKTKIETANSDAAAGNGLGFNYGANTFFSSASMANPVTGAAAVGVYAGLVMRYCSNIEINNILIDGIGYRGNETTSAITYGVDITNSNNLYFDGINVSNAISPAQVIGCHLNTCSSISMKNCVFSNNLAQYVSVSADAGTEYRRVIGLYLESVNTAIMDNVVCNANEANNESDVAARARAYGMLWETGIALELTGVSCDHNEGNSGFCYGMKLDSVESVTMDRASADYNHGTGGDVTADDDSDNTKNMGATGISFSTTAKVISLLNSTANSNYGSSVVGLRVYAGQTVNVSNFASNYSNGSDFVKGMSFRGGIQSCVLKDMSLASNTSTAGAVSAATFASAQSVDISNAVCNYNSAAGAAQNCTALQFTGTAKTLTFDDVQVSSNSAGSTSGVMKALEVTAGQDIVMNQFQANSNTGAGASNMIDFITSIQALKLNNVAINSNVITHATNGLTGLSLAAPLSVSIDKLSIGSNSTSAAGAMQGVVMTTSASSVSMDHTTINGNTSGTGNVRGLIATAPVSFVMKNSLLNDNKHSGTGSGSTVRGIDFQTSASVVSLENVVVSSMTATGSAIPAHGIYMVAPVDLRLTNVACNATTAAGAAIGMELATSAKSVLMKDVVVNYTNSSASTAEGIVMTAAENIIGKNVSGSHSTAASGQAAEGIKFVTSAKSVTLQDSVFNSNSGGAVSGILLAAGQNIKLVNSSTDQNTGDGLVQGMSFTGSISDLGMNKITCNNNSSTGAAVTGIKVASGVAVSIDGAHVNNNSTTVGNAIGLQFSSATDTVTLKNMNVDNISTSASAATAQGISVDTGTNISMTNIATNHIASTNGTPGDVQGITFLTSAKSIDMSNVAMNSNAGAAVHGLKLAAGENVFLQDCFADQNSGTSSAYGIEITGSVNALDAINITGNANTASAGVAGGFKATAATAVKIDGISADYNQAAGGTNEVVGIEFATSGSSVSLKNATANNNTSAGGNSTGIRLAAGLAVSMDNVAANYNLCENASIVRGIHFDTSLQSAHLKNLSADSNYAATPATGMLAVGVHIEQPLSVEINDISASRNIGFDRSYGLFLDGQSSAGSNTSVKNAILNGNTSNSTATAMAAIDTTATVSKHLPVNVFDSITGFTSVLEGAFGVYVYQINSCLLDGVDASRNNGVRAGGMYITTCDDCTVQNSKTSFQQATGGFFFDSDPFNGLTNTAITIPSAQNASVESIYGGTSDASVNLLALTKDFLHGLRNIKSLQDTSNYDPTLSSVYNNISEMSGAQSLMNATIAQFRKFSTAVGVQIHNSENCIVQDHIALGNKSATDSAIGVGISGTAQGHIVLRVKSSSNEAWTDSKLSSTGNINIAAVLPFWTFLEAYVLTATWAGEALNGNQSATSFFTAIASPIVAAQTGFLTTASYQSGNTILAADQPAVPSGNDALSEPTIALDRLAISFISDISNVPVNNMEEFGSIVGGMAVGILVGDASVNSEVDSCDVANNQSNAGQFFGLLQDVTTSLLAKDNRFYQHFANDLGYGFGVAELTLQSNSIHVGNVFFGNAIGDMLNSNYFVPYDPTDYPNIFFPVKIAYNGDIGNFANASPFDNLVIEFIAAKQTSSYIPNDMVTFWNDSGSPTGKTDWTNA